MSDRAGSLPDRRVRRWRFDARRWLCGHGLHWPIRFSDAAYPGSSDPPEPPEPGWACGFCGEVRAPYRWPLWLLRGAVRQPIQTARLGLDYWGRPW